MLALLLDSGPFHSKANAGLTSVLLLPLMRDSRLLLNELLTLSVAAQLLGDCSASSCMNSLGALMTHPPIENMFPGAVESISGVMSLFSF